MSKKITYRSVDIIVPEEVGLTDPIVETARNYIDMRFERPMMLNKRSPETRSIRSASEDELKLAGNGSVPQIHIPLADCEGTIIMPYGTQPENATPEDIKTAKMLWYDSAVIERTDEGVLWVDIAF